MLFLRDSHDLFFCLRLGRYGNEAMLLRLSNVFLGLLGGYDSAMVSFEQGACSLSEHDTAEVNRIVLTLHSLAAQALIKNNPEAGTVDEIINQLIGYYGVLGFLHLGIERDNPGSDLRILNGAEHGIHRLLIPLLMGNTGGQPVRVADCFREIQEVLTSEDVFSALKAIPYLPSEPSADVAQIIEGAQIFVFSILHKSPEGTGVAGGRHRAL